MLVFWRTGDRYFLGKGGVGDPRGTNVSDVPLRSLGFSPRSLAVFFGHLRHHLP